MYGIFSKICLIVFALLVIFIGYKYYKNNKLMIDKTMTTINKKLVYFMDNKYNLIFVLILIVFAFTRLYNLAGVPQGINLDEAATAYNAINIAGYGVDRYLNPFPIYFLNFDGGQSAMYTYLGAILVKIFGYSLFLIRIPAVLFGLLTLIFGTLLAKEIGGKRFSVLIALLITICPYFLMASRWGLDCNLMLGLFTVSIYTLLKAIKCGKIKLYILSGILFGLTLYTYALSYIIIPLVLLGIVIYLIYTKKLNIKQFLAFSIPLFVLAIPLILVVLINAGIINEIKTAFFTIPKMEDTRISEISIVNIFENIKNIGNYLTNDPLIYNAFPRFGTLYLFSIPLVLLGIFIALKRGTLALKTKKFDNYMYINIIFVMLFLCLLFVKDGLVVINKGNAIFICLVIFLGIGVFKVMQFLKNYGFVIIIIYLLAFTYFVYFYFIHYPVVYYPQNSFMDTYVEIIEYSEQFDKDIYIEPIPAGTLWAALASKTSPYEFANAKNQDKHFGHIYLYIPDKFGENNVYGVYEDTAKKLEKKDFKCHNIDNFYACVKE